MSSFAPAPKLEFVSESRGGQKPGHGAIHFDHGVVGDRGSVNDRVDPRQEIPKCEPFALRQPLEPFQYGQRTIGRRAEHLLENPRRHP